MIGLAILMSRRRVDRAVRMIRRARLMSAKGWRIIDEEERRWGRVPPGSTPRPPNIRRL